MRRGAAALREFEVHTYRPGASPSSVHVDAGFSFAVFGDM
jgi:hypothetical protein